MTKFFVLLFIFVITPLIFFIFLNIFSRFSLKTFWVSLIGFIADEFDKFVKISLISFVVFFVFTFISSFLEVNDSSLLVLYVKNGFWYELVVTFWGLVLLVPLVEEVIFRVYLFSLLEGIWEKGSLSRFLILVFSSIVFSISHFENLAVSVFIFVIGLILGWIYLSSRNLFLIYIFHSVFNFYTLIFSIFFV
jgi:membrane protease YdiL (CAAX protease family)